MSFIEGIKKEAEKIVNILAKKNKNYDNSFYIALDKIKKISESHAKNSNDVLNYIHILGFWQRIHDKNSRLLGLIFSDLPKNEKMKKIYSDIGDIIGYSLLIRNYLNNKINYQNKEKEDYTKKIEEATEILDKQCDIKRKNAEKIPEWMYNIDTLLKDFINNPNIKKLKINKDKTKIIESESKNAFIGGYEYAEYKLENGSNELEKEFYENYWINKKDDI